MYELLIKHARCYPFSVSIIAVIWVLSLAPFFPETPLDDVPFVDKWTHFVMYGVMTLVIWWEYRRQHLHVDYRKLLLWGWVMPIVMSGVLELLQEYATTTRNGEWQDLLANAIGVTLGAVIGILMIRCCPKGKRDTAAGDCCRNGGRQSLLFR